MNTKACLVQLILFVLLVVVLALVIRRFVLSPSEPQAVAAATGATAEPKPGLIARLFKGGDTPEQDTADAQANAAAVPLAEALPQGEAAVAQATQAVAAMGVRAAGVNTSPNAGKGIDGLALQLSRPLMFDVPRMRGMAASDQYVYLTINDPAKRNGFVYQLDRVRLTIRQMRSYSAGERYQMGGLHQGRTLLWTTLSGDTPQEGSRVIGIDPITLEERTGFDIVEQIVMVAEGPDEILYGFSSDSATVIVWASTGYELRRHDRACSARYSDVEVVGQSLICVGVEPSGVGMQGVIDVIDTQSLSLLKRHAALGTSGNDEVLTSKGFAYTQGVFLFAPDEGSRPHILSYVPQPGVSLDEYLMSVAR